MLDWADGLAGWLMQGASWPSSQRFGVMNEKLGVVPTDARSVASPVTPRRGPFRHRPASGAERDDVVVAQRGVVDDRVEVHERVVAGRVPVAGHGFLGAVRTVRCAGARRRGVSR